MDVHSEFAPKKFGVLFRIIRCLDCPDIIGRKDNDCTSLMTTRSDINT